MMDSSAVFLLYLTQTLVTCVAFLRSMGKSSANNPTAPN